MSNSQTYSDLLTFFRPSNDVIAYFPPVTSEPIFVSTLPTSTEAVAVVAAVAVNWNPKTENSYNSLSVSDESEQANTYKQSQLIS